MIFDRWNDWFVLFKQKNFCQRVPYFAALPKFHVLLSWGYPWGICVELPLGRLSLDGNLFAHVSTAWQHTMDCKHPERQKKSLNFNTKGSVSKGWDTILWTSVPSNCCGFVYFQTCSGNIISLFQWNLKPETFECEWRFCKANQYLALQCKAQNYKEVFDDWPASAQLMLRAKEIQRKCMGCCHSDQHAQSKLKSFLLFSCQYRTVKWDKQMGRSKTGSADCSGLRMAWLSWRT